MQVTVIMPTYNHERYVREAIESVFSQQVELELLIMDDGSTDGTRHAVWSALSAHPGRAHALHHELVCPALDVHVHGPEGGDLHVLLRLEVDPLATVCEHHRPDLAAGVLQREIIMSGRVLLEVGDLSVDPEVPDGRRTAQNGLHTGVELGYRDRLRHAGLIAGAVCNSMLNVQRPTL